MDSKRKLWCEEEIILVDKGQYQHLVGRLVYLTHTWLDMGFVVSVKSQFMNHSMKELMEVVYRIQEKGYYSRRMDVEI